MNKFAFDMSPSIRGSLVIPNSIPYMIIELSKKVACTITPNIFNNMGLRQYLIRSISYHIPQCNWNWTVE
jgi:hypothetical protein